MNFLIKPSSLHSEIVTVPGDKSISHRSLMLGSIAHGDTHVSDFLAGEDCLCTLAALQSMGVQAEYDGDTSVTIRGSGLHGLSASATAIDLGNSGTGMRLFAGLLSGQQFASKLIGDESLSARPMGRVIRPLTDMGAEIGSIDGRPPLSITGGRALTAIEYEMPVASAQVKSALLLAGLYAKGTTTIAEPATTRDHTERMFESMGIELIVAGNTVSLAGGQQPRGTDIRVPADLSSAAFLLLAAILADECEITVPNVGINPSRTGVLDILGQMGAEIMVRNQRMFGSEPVADVTAWSSKLKGIEVDPSLVSLAIDEFPLLFVAASQASGATRFSGLAELRVKESDRIGSMALGLTSLGIDVEESDDGALIHGGQWSGGDVQSFGDHRIAMAFAIGAATASGPVVVHDTDAVNTSFPGFADSLYGCGLKIETAAGAGQ